MKDGLREKLAWEHISWERLRTTSHLGPYQLQIFDMGIGHARPIWLTLFGEPKPETGEPNILFEHAFKTIEAAKAAAEPMMLKYLDDHGLPGVESYLRKPIEPWLERWGLVSFLYSRRRIWLGSNMSWILRLLLMKCVTATSILHMLGSMLSSMSTIWESGIFAQSVRKSIASSTEFRWILRICWPATCGVSF